MFFLEEIRVQKKSGGTPEDWDSDKLLAAVNKSAARARGYNESENCDCHLTDEESAMFLSIVTNKVIMRSDNVISTSALHIIVENALKEVAPDVAKSYADYRNFRIQQAERWERIKGQAFAATNNGDKQNANADSSLASTLKCFTADYAETEIVEEFLMTAEDKKAVADGYLYWHDRSGLRIYAYNCCLCRVGTIMQGGFSMNNVQYTEPKGLDVAMSVAADIIFITASQQYGGCTCPRIDSIMAPYAEKSYNKLLSKYLALGIPEETAKETAYEDVKKMAEQGFQEWEMKFNTVASSRGDYPFVTVSGGVEHEVYDSGIMWGPTIWKACCDVRRIGQGEEGKKRPVVFPKIVFLYDENLHGKGKPLEFLFEAGVACSNKSMYPDWLSLTGEGYVPSMYKMYGERGIISPMGCRAFLSPWYERGGMEPADENDYPVFEGRFNIGVISLNLPMILAKSQRTCTDFYKVLDYYLELIRCALKRRYAYIGQIKASRNPLMFCEGGALGGNLGPHDRIEPLLKSATASFGVTALNELQQLYNGKSLVEDGQFALEVMEHINEFVNKAKKEDGHLYAIYGTPAENLCGKQVRQFRAKYGIVKNVSDREYVSNSFHCHVTESISPIQKQNFENRFWNLFNGGKIQYCRYPIGYNTEAMKSLINRAMDMGFYEGVNLSLTYCNDCGHEELEIGENCPVCGSKNITQIDRMNGYLSYTRQGSSQKGFDSTKENRFSHHKMKEINERVSM